MEQGLCLVMVGLPARGKSYITNKLSQYLTWMGFETKVFNVGQARRKAAGYAVQNHEFFSSSDEHARRMREEIAFGVLDDLLDWLAHDPSRVGVFDATNTTMERRRKIRETCITRNVPTLFIESICDDPVVLEQNINLKLKNNDYKEVDPAQARADFLLRVKAYEERYQTISVQEEAENMRYVKLYNVGKKITTHLCTGYLPGQISMFLTNCHIVPRKIFLSRHGQSQDNVKELLGGDSHLTAKGIAYARSLAKYLHELNIDNLTIWTSALHRTRETAKFVNLFSEPYGRKYHIVQSRLLNEIDAGACNHMTYKQIQKELPHEFKAREADKLRYRYPQGGESYTDLIERLKPIIIELERYRTPVLVICHQAVMRVLLSYFIRRPQNECPHLECPLHNLVQLTPGPYDCHRQDVSLEMQVRELMQDQSDKFDRLVVTESMTENPHSGNSTQVEDMYVAQKRGVGDERSPLVTPSSSSSIHVPSFNLHAQTVREVAQSTRSPSIAPVTSLYGQQPVSPSLLGPDPAVFLPAASTPAAVSSLSSLSTSATSTTSVSSTGAGGSLFDAIVKSSSAASVPTLSQVNITRSSSTPTQASSSVSSLSSTNGNLFE